ncbi:MAG: metallophosphoesterase [Spirochaetales bacterium]|nr:metallophosphoesterase [Spirochaetales bacterium]
MNITSETIKKATSVLAELKQRKKDKTGKPGGLVNLESDKRKVILIGDLHGAYDNLIKVIEDNDNMKEIKSGKAVLIIIGDGIHNDQTGQMLEMQSSLLVLEEIINLIVTYEGSVIYIRGNHDTFEERLAKSGIKQGLEFKMFLLEHRGIKYVNAVENFFESLPMFITGNGFAITHAGPIRGGCSREELINIRQDPELAHQLMWNRLHEFRGTPSLKEYDEKDIRSMLRKLDLPEDNYFIVGHNPMWNTGNRTGIWQNIIGIKNHIIIISNIETRAPYLIIQDGLVTEHFAIPKGAEKYYV